MALFAFATSFVIFLVLGLVLVNLHLKQDVAQPPASNADEEANETSVASEANLTDSVTEDVTEPAWMWIEKRSGKDSQNRLVHEKKPFCRRWQDGVAKGQE
ncbi:hypothetical protein IscW_ISCW021988 [Ixodes scapularis]|uniref:Secreted protein n=1 Tax=Ixodes scapularis TaxID=6945 RepID=B7QFZ4_IXOSC|nr:hypothetical protein IscW_ISCW021988 [Ixodes scapularis]|eukprot:XP_002401057.1 hypothetical protein IscW_ISCW021988 [Ixodes scapularis]